MHASHRSIRRTRIHSYVRVKRWGPPCGLSTIALWETRLKAGKEQSVAPTQGIVGQSKDKGYNGHCGGHLDVGSRWWRTRYLGICPVTCGHLVSSRCVFFSSSSIDHHQPGTSASERQSGVSRVDEPANPTPPMDEERRCSHSIPPPILRPNETREILI